MTETDEALAREWLAEDEGPYVGEMDNVGYHRARKAVEDTRVDLLASLLQRVRNEERQKQERQAEGQPDIWCNMGGPHRIGEGICSCRGAREVKEERQKAERIVEDVRHMVPFIDPEGESYRSACDEIIRRLKEE